MIKECRYNFYTCSFIGQVSFCNECEGGSNYTWNEYFSEMKEIFKYVVAKHFFKEYCPTVKSWNKKLSGKNSNGNPLEFTEADKAAIREGIEKLTSHLKDQ